jgi:hypothetical protein
MQAKCRQIERRDMENFEGWDPHPTRKNIYINKKDWEYPLSPLSNS